MKRTTIIQADAFAAEPFHGNPAAVCLLREEATEAWMQAVAAEMNLSETAFVRHLAKQDFSLRWFTPAVEVPLCGHATLASAHVLWEEKLASSKDPITFHTRERVLNAHRESGWIRLDFPAIPVEPCESPPGLAETLGCQPVSVHANHISMTTCLVEVDSEATVRGLRPDFGRLHDVEFDGCIVTAVGGSGSCDFVSRFFAPRVGIDEDPVTGSAHCSLGPYWAGHLGKTELVAHQVSKRGGLLKLRVRGDRVDILGQALTVMRGEMLH